MKTIWLAVIAAATTPFLAATCESAELRPGESPPPLGFESILQAPDGVLPNWNALRGKVVVLEFWATWCGPCIAAFPHLNELADKFKGKNVQFIAVTDEEEKVVTPFLRKKPMHAWIGLDTDKSMFKAYGITGIPQTVVVDQQGNIAVSTHPTMLTEEHLKDLLAGKRIALARSGEGRQVTTPVSKPQGEPLFEVSIRPSERGGTRWSSGKGRYTGSSVTALDILCSIHNLEAARTVMVSALPEGRFDFIVQAPGTDEKELKSWLQQAAESAFGVTARRETREMDALVLKAGKPSEHLAETASTGGSSVSSGGGSLNCVNQSMTSFARCLEDILKKPVINETGLTNGYDFQLLWSEKEGSDDDPVELATALREQLGLELTSAKRQVDVLTVSAANRGAGKPKGQSTN